MKWKRIKWRLIINDGFDSNSSDESDTEPDSEPDNEFDSDESNE